MHWEAQCIHFPVEPFMFTFMDKSGLSDGELRIPKEIENL